MQHQTKPEKKERKKPVGISLDIDITLILK